MTALVWSELQSEGILPQYVAGFDAVLPAITVSVLALVIGSLADPEKAIDACSTETSISEEEQRLKTRIDSGLILLPGNDESPMNYAANTYPFRQDSTFLYFFGLDQPGLAAVIDVDDGHGMCLRRRPNGRGDRVDGTCAAAARQMRARGRDADGPERQIEAGPE